MNKAYKLMFTIFVFFFAVVILTAIPSVSSGSEVINTFLVYEDSASSTSKTVTQGDYFNVVMVAYGHGEALQYEKLELVGSTLIFQEYVAGDKIDTYTWLYTKTYTLNTGILTPGTYTLRFTARTATTSSVEYSDLQLTILPKIIPPVCGNNIKEGTEQCDYGTLNGQVCNPLYGSSCTYCSSACKLVTLTGAYCGDGVCSAVNGETCSTCPTDCGVCPDNLKPVVDITNPLATTYTSHRTSLTFSVYDDNLQSCTYKLNSNPAVSVSSVVNGVRTITGITSVVGTNTWTVTCRDVAGNVGSDSVAFTVTLPAVCGDGVKEGTEQCDYGTLNGQVCNPLYGSSCTYCSSICKLVTLTGAYCGDGVCSAVNGETCSTCPTDCGVCPDNIKPVVDITNPLATTYTSHRTSLTFSVYDDNLQSCTYKLNSNPAVSVSSVVNGVRTITGITSVVGTNTWTVTCRDVAGNVGSDSVAFTVTLPAVCGDGVKEGTEQCDYGTLNGQVCNPLYGSSCTYCSSICKLVTLTGAYCGDGVKQSNEQCDDGNKVSGDGCSSACQIEEAKECILQLSKSVNDTNVQPGEVVKFTLKYKNIGTGICTGGGVEVQDVLSLNLEKISYSMSVNGDTDGQGISFGYSGIPGYDSSTNTLTFNAHTVSPGEEGTILITAKILEPVQCGDFQINNYFKVWSNEKGWQSSNTVKIYVDNDCYLPVCGDGVKEGTEQCDYGTSNGQVCNPLYGSSCTYCSSTCKLVTLTGAYCGDGICSAVNGETCSTCPTDCGVCPVACDLTQAYWSVSSTLSGQVVSLIVKGTNCNGKTILFKVWNDKTGSSDLYVTDTAIDVMQSGTATSAWVAVAPYDQDSTPEYYFVASVFEGSESVKSGNLLVSIPASCGDGVCDANENCLTCPEDCGVCPDNIKPVVNIINPANITYTSHRTNLTFSVYDDNLESCAYRLNGAPQVNVVSLNNGINIITGITSITGTNTWEVACKDASGNIGTDSVTFTITGCTSCCGDGVCDESAGENCSNCPYDCGVCPKNCTTCKDSKPLDDSNYIPSGKTIIVYDDSDDLPSEDETALNKTKFPLIALILIIGVLILLILIIILRIARR